MDSSGPVTPAQIDAMISLLDDDSASVVGSCLAALVRHADQAEPVVRERLADADEELRGPLSHALTEIVSARTEDELVRHLAGTPDLERGSILLGRLIDPGEDPDAVPPALDALGEALATRVEDLEDEDEGRRMLTELLVRQHGLLGREAGEFERLDAVVHGTILRRRGMPLPLSIVWILVARRCGLPVVGLNMPARFLVGYGRDPESALMLDPFDGGKVIGPEECEAFLRAYGYPASVKRPEVASDREMLVRTLSNLLIIARGEKDRALEARCVRILRHGGDGRRRRD